MRLSYAKQLHTVAACSRCGFNSVSVQTPKIHTLPSPFADVLGATLAFDNPSADTQERFRTILSNIDTCLRESDADIYRLEIALRAAKEERKALQDFRDIHAALLPPIHSLPDDVLYEIFDHIEFVKPYDVSDPRHGPWLLGKICRRWRHLVLSSPSLWSAFFVDISKNCSLIHRDASLFLGATLCLKEAFARSNPLPVDFSVDPIPWSDNECSREFLRILMNQTERWQKVSLGGMDVQGFDFLAAARAPGIFASLSALTLDVEDVRMPRQEELLPSPFTQHALPYFRQSPNLQSLTLTGLPDLEADMDPAEIDFPWAQLTHLKYTSAFHPSLFTTDLDRKFIFACPNLESFSTTSIASSRPVPLITHPHLQSLNLLATSLLRALDVPSLRSLSFAWGDLIFPENDSGSKHFPRHIQEIVWHATSHIDRTEELPSDLLHLFPSVTRLQIDGSITELLLRQFIATRESRTMPLLTYLGVSGLAGYQEVMANVMTSIVESRWSRASDAPVSRLTDVHIELSALRPRSRGPLMFHYRRGVFREPTPPLDNTLNDVATSMVEKLAVFKSEGLNVSVEYQHSQSFF